MKLTPKVLFVTYGGGHIAMVLPVIRALRAQVPGVHVDLIALTTAYETAKAAGEKPLQYVDLMHLVDSASASQWGRLASPSSHPHISEAENQAYHGVNYWDLVQQFGEAEAARRFVDQGRYGFSPLLFFRRVLASLAPDVVVATNSPRSEEAALEAAIGMGIPTLSMTDLFALPYDKYHRRTVYADRVTVIGQQVKDTLKSSGVPGTSLRVTGNPAFDGLTSPERKAQSRAFLAQRGWQGKTVVLWAGHIDDYSSANPEMQNATNFPRQVESALRSWTLGDENRALIIRYHPNEMQHFPAGAKHPRIAVSTLDQHIHEAILAADAVVVQMSTVGLESSTAGKPVVAMVNSPSCLAFGFNYEQLGVAYAAQSIAELPARLEHALTYGSCAHGIWPAGNSAQLIAKEIQDLISGH